MMHHTPLEIIYNKPHPSVLIHIKDEESRKILLLFIQEVKREIIYRRMNIRENQMNRTTPRIRIQAHISTVIKKITSLLEYRGIMENKQSIQMMKKLQEIQEDRIQ